MPGKIVFWTACHRSGFVCSKVVRIIYNERFHRRHLILCCKERMPINLDSINKLIPNNGTNLNSVPAPQKASKLWMAAAERELSQKFNKYSPTQHSSGGTFQSAATIYKRYNLPSKPTPGWPLIENDLDDDGFQRRPWELINIDLTEQTFPVDAVLPTLSEQINLDIDTTKTFQ